MVVTENLVSIEVLIDVNDITSGKVRRGEVAIIGIVNRVISFYIMEVLNIGVGIEVDIGLSTIISVIAGIGRSPLVKIVKGVVISVEESLINVLEVSVENESQVLLGMVALIVVSLIVVVLEVIKERVSAICSLISRV